MPGYGVVAVAIEANNVGHKLKRESLTFFDNQSQTGDNKTKQTPKVTFYTIQECIPWKKFKVHIILEYL